MSWSKAPNYDARKGEGICLLFPNAFLKIRYTIPNSARYKRLFSIVPVKNGRLFPQK